MAHGVQASPQELRSFAQFLRRFSTDLENQAGRAQGQLRGLGQSWRDDKYRNFEQEAQEMFKSLRRFSQSSEQYSKYLERLAGDLEQYQRR